ncbi:histidine--tRNA ligase [Capnocytophaga stomatis]|uniref:histidine--tRNA ligase n=1 Tax=Capnocytophaga stomatis TaxID=1848904 RepID=UPI00194F8624|nr:histidine--tRNA ligase [Capnocytophaga stomatis]GIJ96949.1 histidine--tRNA ligase [Capnocytophaga stomatis]
MAIQKPSLPKGTRDFSPTELAKRNYIIDKIRTEFVKFGFQPIETPSFENYETLMGKYGEEGDRLIFKILNSGNFAEKVNSTDWETKNVGKLTPQICEKALRYDLTVPFARYVVQHQNDITFPFKRFQIQPVWRADRPQKGRFREFYQCDADVVGSNSLWQEVEFVQLYDSVFTSLNLKGVTIKINNRKILSGFAEVIGESEKLIDFTVALDKLDKIGQEGVVKEMLSKGISEQAIEKISPIFSLGGSFSEKINLLKEILKDSETGKKGIEELEFIEKAINHLSLQTAVLDLDVTLARGLNYYTGAIFEVAAPEGIAMGSIGGGGRYDDLTSIFGLKGISGVGISFGLDRICLVMEELNLFPEEIGDTLDVLCINFGEKEALQSLKLIQKLRSLGKKSELYPESAKMKKQMAYADKRNIPFVVLIGESECEKESFILKNMKTGEQKEYLISEVEKEIFK